MRVGKTPSPTLSPRPNQGGDRPLAPELLEIIRALARDAARRDHAADEARTRDHV